ncbi:PREDICTED: LOW QUALITY PROTEIN: enoyl-CoA delta isomerase 2, peroxisomal-like [Prunus mume]|uniref:LOW QUALITY PROTEIN: enoyl-CoA delta isomerase 2, peroxisomal-like n=1 Tax=Prunus mume TaxID=102107 RepID=A0ABM1LIK8_PRUMU|nr:PREDICTED: LOW QUALITY PROTEIN: enoyl-CoA delta isomerase 2, peroxisomal-like [Prunus mume]
MCTLEKRGDLFFLTLTGDDEHRLSLTLIDSLLSALSQAKSQATRGSVLVTTAHGKFFSNGFDLGWAQAAGSASAALARLSKMVAALARFLLALSHDYFLMRRDRGVLYMSEVDLGLPFPDYFTAAFLAKMGSVSGRRDVMLRGMKLKGDEAVKLGIVESAHDSAESTVEAAVRLGEQLAKRKWNGDVYAEIRKSLYPELCGVVGVAVATPKAKL